VISEEPQPRHSGFDPEFRATPSHRHSGLDPESRAIPSLRHSGLDPESRGFPPAVLDSGFRRNDKLTLISSQGK
jgi:hypothetical protein